MKKNNIVNLSILKYSTSTVVSRHVAELMLFTQKIRQSPYDSVIGRLSSSRNITTSAKTFQLLRLTFHRSAGAVVLCYLCLSSKRILITYNYLLPIFLSNYYLSALRSTFVHI